MRMKNRLINFDININKRISNHALIYPTPVNLSYAWSFGSLVGLYFVMQVLTGVFLGTHYILDSNVVFDNVVHIMRDVKYGWIVWYMHTNGDSIIFMLLYLHIGRSIYYQSYLYRREELWWSGIVMFLLMMATSFLGNVLPWAQVLFLWSKIIISLVITLFFGPDRAVFWLWNEVSLADKSVTYVRFLDLHYVLPFFIAGFLILHILIFKEERVSNPWRTTRSERVSFGNYFISKNFFAFVVVLFFFIWLVFFNPNLLGHPDLWVKYNVLVTPAHIIPKWYFTPFYAILRACPDKLGGVIGMAGSLIILFVLPYYRLLNSQLTNTVSPIFKIFFWQFASIFLILMFLGGKPAVEPYVLCSKILTVLYFSYFILFLSSRAYIETTVAKNST